MAELLLSHADPDTGLIPTHFKAGFKRRYDTQSDPAKSVRYSAICYEGLRAADQAGLRPFPTHLHQRFTERFQPEPALQGNLGPNAMEAWLGTDPDLQQVAWMLDRAPAHRHRLMRHINRHLWHSDSLFARHRARSIRGNIVSFGAMAYFLAALLKIDDPVTRIRALEAVEAMIEQQRPDGGWPWLYRVASGQAVADYPLYTVHQDAMAPMFLLPAMDLGLGSARTAMEKSLAWVANTHSLNADPLMLTRAHQRPGDGRLMRGIWAMLAHRRREPRHVGVIDGWRSYHIGWMLAVWSPRLDAPHWLSQLEPAK
jgi:hypothetical protein